MSLLYIEDIPFEYKRYNKNKDIKLSNGLKERFDQYYREIKASDSLKIAEWTEMAKRLKSAVRDEVRKNGNKKSIYVEDYVQFIFGVSYLLFAKDPLHPLSQRKVSEILGITPTKYSKLDIFPDRSYQAYTKLDDEPDDETNKKPDKKSNKKSLIPGNMDSKGIQIAECINQRIQAVYACYAFVGVSNDLDVFANISTTDRIKYIMTISSGHSTDTSVRLMQNMGYARFLFATANNFENVQGQYVSGKIKREIIELLKMRYSSVLCKSKRVEQLLSDGSEYKKYIMGNSDDFDLTEYRVYKNALLEMEENNDRLPYRDWYDGDEDEDGTYLDISESGIPYGEEYFDEIYDWIAQRVSDIRVSLIKKMSYYTRGKFDMADFEDYRLCLLTTLVQDFEINARNPVMVDTKIDLGEKIRYAAIYWLWEVLGLGQVEEAKVKDIRKWLEKKHLLSYFDSINKEFGKGKKPHTFLEPDDFDILAAVKEVYSTKTELHRPALLYIDAKAYPNIKDCMDRLLSEFRLILIVHDDEGVMSGYNMQDLDQELNLYYLEGKADGK